MKPWDVGIFGMSLALAWQMGEKWIDRKEKSLPGLSEWCHFSDLRAVKSIYFVCLYNCLVTKMASRGGVMVTGTNGADFEHREKIAAQYQIRYVIWLIYKYLRP